MAVTEKQLANIIPPKVGEIRNPNGKPKGRLNSSTIIRKWLETKEKIHNPITGETIEMSQYDAIVLAQLTKAKKSDTQAFNALLDRLEGKPTQRTELTGRDGEALTSTSININAVSVPLAEIREKDEEPT